MNEIGQRLNKDGTTLSRCKESRYLKRWWVCKTAAERNQQQIRRSGKNGIRTFNGARQVTAIQNA